MPLTMLYNEACKSVVMHNLVHQLTPECTHITHKNITDGLQPHHHIQILRERVKHDGFVSVYLEDYLSAREKTVSELEKEDVRNSRTRYINTLKTILNEFASIIAYNCYLGVNLYSGKNDSVIFTEHIRVLKRLSEWLRGVYDLFLYRDGYDLFVYNIEADSDFVHYPHLADPLISASIPEFNGPNLFYTQTTDHLEKCIEEHKMPHTFTCQ